MIRTVRGSKDVLPLTTANVEKLRSDNQVVHVPKDRSPVYPH